MTARTLAERLIYTTRPVSRRRTVAARWIGRTCSVVLLLLGLWGAAAGTWASALIAVYALTAGVWCWRHQARMRDGR